VGQQLKVAAFRASGRNSLDLLALKWIFEDRTIVWSADGDWVRFCAAHVAVAVADAAASC
jgi:hypothetical protein